MTMQKLRNVKNLARIFTILCIEFTASANAMVYIIGRKSK